MSFGEHYLQKLEKSPSFKQYQLDRWADYLELVCLASADNEVSDDDIIDRIQNRSKDLKEDNEENLEEVESLESEENPEGISRRAEISDKWESRVKDYFIVLNLRVKSYGNAYPFIIERNCIKRKKNLAYKNYLYVYLLLSSNLYLFDESTRLSFANHFELISFNAFKNLLPKKAIAHLFGKNPYNIGNKYSGGTLWKKINLLKEEINEELSSHIKEEEFPATNTGDNGLDIFGWVPTGDILSSKLIHFAQCACTEEFDEKQHTSSYNNWREVITFKNPPTNTIFIPFCYRGSKGEWIQSRSIKSSFMVDRKRIMNFYRDTKKYKFSKMDIYQKVKDILSLKETVV